MSMPPFFVDKIKMDEYLASLSSESRREMNKDSHIHIVTFCTDNWPKAIRRFDVQTKAIALHHDFFTTTRRYTENDLGDDWRRAVGEHLGEMGFGRYAWKPYLINRRMNELADGETILWWDAGCDFPNIESLQPFLKALADTSEAMAASGATFAMPVNRHYKHCYVSNSIPQLDFFGLRSDDRYLYEFPHYENGAMLIRITKQSRNTVLTWRDVTFKNMDALFPTGGDFGVDGFVHNSCDQSILQAILYKQTVKVMDATELFYRHDVYARKRG